MGRGRGKLRSTNDNEGEETHGAQRKNVRRTIQVNGTYDVETEAGFGAFLVGGLYDGTTYVERDWRRESGLARDVTSTDGYVWAHNGGVFDAKWLLERIRASGATARVRAAGSRIVSLRSGGTESLDSKALTKLSLAQFSEGVGVAKSAHGLACVTPENCGPWCAGYCRFRRGMERRAWNQVREYLRIDCVSLWQSLERLQAWAEKEDLDLAPTVGAASFSHARRMLGLPDADLTVEEHRFAREAYYGGRVECFREEANSGGYEYDVNAMYSAAGAALAMPVGRPRTCGHEGACRAFQSGSPAIIRAKVRVPDMWVPPLPVRVEGRTAFPTGDFAGVWTSIELEYAASLGVKVEPIEALVWPHSECIFAPWVKKLWDLRFSAEGGKSGPFGTFLKFYLNSLWGKFGSQPENEGFVVNPSEVTERMGPAIGKDIYKTTQSGVRYRHGRWVAGSPCCHVEWAAFVTSWARIEWHRQATSVEMGADLIYCDTDSLFCLRPRTRAIGVDCGQWKPEPRFQRMSVLAPKFYRVERGGEWKVKSKGVHATRPQEWDSLWNKGAHRFAWDSSMGFRTAARKGALFVPSSMARNVKRGYGTRVSMGDGLTRPPSAKELNLDAERERQAARRCSPIEAWLASEGAFGSSPLA